MERIYLDYSSTAPVDSAVLKAMKPYFSGVFGNPGSLHQFGQEASAAVFKARRGIGAAIGTDYKEIIFTGSATEANNLALRGTVNNLKSLRLWRTNLKSFSKPRLIISAIEHESILETAKDLESQGVEVIYLPVSREGIVDLKKLEASLNKRTALVSIMYANNEIGSIQPIAEIAKAISNLKSSFQFPVSSFPVFHTDAVQALQYLDCGVNNLGVDLMTISAHKIYGPKGIGALYVRNPKQIPNPKSQILNPIITGGGQEFGIRSGTENVPYIVGFGKAVKLALERRKKEIKRVAQLRDYFWRELKKIYEQVELNGPDFRERLPNNLNIHFPGYGANELLIKLDLAGISVSAGSACASRISKPSHVLSIIGLDARRASQSLRFTLGRPTSRGEISQTLKVIKNVLKK